MIPDESELLSTRIYGFQKHSLQRRGVDTEPLPPLKGKVGHRTIDTSTEKSYKFSRVYLNSVIEKRESEDFSTSDATEQLYLLNTLRKKIKLKLSDRANTKSIKISRKNDITEDVGPEPWFLDREDSFK